MTSNAFDDILKTIEKELNGEGIPFKLITEYNFASRMFNRRFRSDYAELDYGILLEYEGLQSKKSRSRHTTIDGFTRDCTKYNMCTSMGFSCLRYTRNHLDKDMIKEDIKRTIEVKKLFTDIGEKCPSCTNTILIPKMILLDNMCLTCEHKIKEKKKPKAKDAAAKQKRISDDLEMLLRISASTSSPSPSPRRKSVHRPRHRSELPKDTP